MPFTNPATDVYGSGAVDQQFDDTSPLGVRQLTRVSNNTAETLLSRHKSGLTRYATRLGSQDPEGIADMAVFDTIRRMPEDDLQKDKAVAAYLYRTAHGLAVDELRRRKPPVPAEASELDVVVEDGSSNVDLAILLDDAVEQLTTKQATVIRARFLQGKSVQEIAAEMDAEPNAVYQIQHRALKRLRVLVTAALALCLVAALAFAGVFGQDSEPTIDEPVDQPESDTGPSDDVDALRVEVEDGSATTDVGSGTDGASERPQTSTTSVDSANLTPSTSGAPLDQRPADATTTPTSGSTTTPTSASTTTPNATAPSTSSNEAGTQTAQDTPPTSEPQVPQPQPGGPMAISGQASVGHTGMCLTASGANAVQATCVGSASQIWTTRIISGDVVDLVDRNGQCLQLEGRGPNVGTSPCTGQSSQQWWVVPNGAGPGVYSILSATSGSCLEVLGEAVNEGGNVGVSLCHYGPSQQWLHEFT